jgi:dihydrofolate synthase/folylpolyglutamate synthase
VLLDGAHNPAGAAALAQYLRDTYPGGLPLIFAAMRDKHAALMLETLRPAVTALVLTEPHNARARSAEDLATAACAAGFPPGRVEIERRPADALERAWAAGSVACAAGSLFLVGELIEAIGRRYQPRTI